MSRLFPSISTEQIRAFVELANTGGIRLAAKELHISEEGLRSRLMKLEQRLGVTLYQKLRGRRSEVKLTYAGQAFLGKAAQFLEDARILTYMFDPGQRSGQLIVAASQYITYYLLVDIIRAFQACHPQINVRLLTREEREIMSGLYSDQNLALGLCAPPEYPADLVCQPWFAMEWYFVAPLGHPLLQNSKLNLVDLTGESLIVFESGSTGRQHVLEAFYQRGLSPRIGLEATSTQTILHMVEACLGVAIVPLLPSGVVTSGISVGSVPLRDQIRRIDSCILFRPERRHDTSVQCFVEFVQSRSPCSEQARSPKSFRTRAVVAEGDT
jgi:DNA-binding transcriptional LysR family regulator